MIETEHPVHIDRAALEAKLKRLARLYQDGPIDDRRYEQDRDAIRAQLTKATIPLPFADLSSIATLLGDLPGLLKEATNEERRAVLVQLVDQVYLTHDAVLGIRPTLRAWPLMHAVYAQFLTVSLGGPGGYPAAIFRTLPPIRTFEDLLQKAGLRNVYGPPTA